jgi:hypothetical protein
MKTARLRLATALVLVLTLSRPVAAHHTPSHNQCAPILYCLFAGCWYELLNNPDFSGTPASCTNWVGASVTSSADCWNSNAAVLSSGSSVFTQNFTVPADSAGTLEIGLEFATLGGTPASTSDRILLELYEGTLLRKRVTIYTMNSPTYCHREDFSYGTTSFAGKNLQLRVRALFGTPGISYRINWVQIFGDA